MNTFNQLQSEARSPLTAAMIVASLLLITVFAVGCSDQSMSALSSDDGSTLTDTQSLTENEQAQFDAPMLAKPAGSNEATYRVTFSGDITGGPAEQTKSIRPSSSGVGINPITLDVTYFQTAIAGGENCFSSGEYAGPLQIHIEKNVSDPAQSHFYFWATASDGASETKYVLTMNGQFSDPNNWPPAVGTQNTIMMTDWDMANGASKKNRNIACTAKGIFNSGVTILVERIN